MAGTEAPSLAELIGVALDEVAWDAFSRGSVIRRAGRVGFARNVCVRRGNGGAGGEAVRAELAAALGS
jgi:epoxyqueuosine reductase QueG